MRRFCRWALLTLTALLVVMCVCLSVMHSDARLAVDRVGSAALGMVLLNDDDCLYVLAVSDQSPAHLAGLVPGDYILAADGVPVRNTETFDEILSAGGEAVQLSVRRLKQEITLSLECR